MKICKKCSETKPLEDYYVHRKNRDGRCGACKECCKAISAKWRLDHPEKVRARGVKRYRDNSEAIKARFDKMHKDNPEMVKTAVTKWNKNHPEAMKANSAKWVKANPEAVKARKAKRRAAKLAYEGPSYTAADVAILLVGQHSLCAYCGVVLNGKYHIDHVIPLSQGGGNGPDNIALACASCNLSKADKSLLMWAMFLGWRLQ